MSQDGTRIERDSMGDMEVPADAFYGASTMRAALNFPISDLRLPQAFIHTLGLIKAAGATVNGELGLLSSDVASAIALAAREVAEGKWDHQFIVDVFQTGSGTSTNMNANEVIARRAAELLSGRLVHPNDEVNLCQSSNDVIPATIRVAALSLIKSELDPALDALERALEVKATEFWGVIKTGRTHLQDATPIRLGQEFRGYAGQMRRASRRINLVCDELTELPLGGTAVGTGIGCHPEFPSRTIAHLSRMTGLPLRETDNHFQAQSSLDSVVAASGALRTLALAQMKIGNDIRWLGSGPRAGLGELKLPSVQPGSSIMPGKVNPVIVESLLQVCAQVLGNDAIIITAAQGSHFELNMMLPVAAYSLLQSISLLAAAARNFENQCLKGLVATDRGPELVESGLGIATALAPRLGYDAAAKIAYEAGVTGETILQAASRLTDLTQEDLRRLLDPSRLVEAGLG